MNRISVALVIVLITTFGTLVAVGFRAQQLEHELYLINNYLFSCDGSLLRIKGGDATARDFAKSHCQNYDLAIANQDMLLE